MNTTGILSRKPQMANGNEKMRYLKICMRQFAYRAITFNKGVPSCVLLALEYHTAMKKYGDVVSQISGTAFVEIEEHCLSGSRSLQRNVSVVAVAITVAVRP